jgi:coenzyme F420-reducing hydrogenase alpha subunit
MKSKIELTKRIIDFMINEIESIKTDKDIENHISLTNKTFRFEERIKGLHPIYKKYFKQYAGQFENGEYDEIMEEFEYYVSRYYSKTKFQHYVDIKYLKAYDIKEYAKNNNITDIEIFMTASNSITGYMYYMNLFVEKNPELFN